MIQDLFIFYIFEYNFSFFFWKDACMHFILIRQFLVNVNHLSVVFTKQTKDVKMSVNFHRTCICGITTELFQCTLNNHISQGPKRHAGKAQRHKCMFTHRH